MIKLERINLKNEKYRILDEVNYLLYANQYARVVVGPLMPILNMYDTIRYFKI